MGDPKKLGTPKTLVTLAERYFEEKKRQAKLMVN
jgi:hypothetical protein